MPDSPPSAADADHLSAAYLALVPKVRQVTRWYFRHVGCADTRHDLQTEAVALGWLWFLRLAAKHKDPTAFATVFAYTLARAVSSGRRLCGHEKARDALSPVCRWRHEITVSPIPSGSSLAGNLFDEALRDNTLTPVPDQVQFGLDFPRRRRSLPAGRRRVLDALAAGERAADLAARLGVTPGRVSQLRSEFRDGWAAFCGDAATA